MEIRRRWMEIRRRWSLDGNTEALVDAMSKPRAPREPRWPRATR